MKCNRSSEVSVSESSTKGKSEVHARHTRCRKELKEPKK